MSSGCRRRPGTYSAARLIRNSCTADLAHADVLRRLTAAGEVGPTTRWTLLRGAPENSTTGLWLLDGAGRGERRRRAPPPWDEDMRNRHQHETDTGHFPSGGGMTGARRRAEIGAIAEPHRSRGNAQAVSPRTTISDSPGSTCTRTRPA
ncbi:hypothetical protein ACH4ZX_37760 [Streptomyces sp. NPDC020490]|uniref:hypothetical protein n=1 Tax=Streptomyces sp. NPDC020490 TaxID=3365078 RepID=UPI0037B866DA